MSSKIAVVTALLTLTRIFNHCTNASFIFNIGVPKTFKSWLDFYQLDFAHSFLFGHGNLTVVL